MATLPQYAQMLVLCGFTRRTGRAVFRLGAPLGDRGNRSRLASVALFPQIFGLVEFP